jgi:hypothetical protein
MAGAYEGRAGRTYANRADMTAGAQAVRAGASQEYGQRKQLEDQQRAMPLPLVGRQGPVVRPSEMPNEPVTTGLPGGPGAGPEALAALSPLDELRVAYATHPNEDLRRLIERLERKGIR